MESPMAATRIDYTSCSRRRGLASQAGERRTARGEAFHLGDGADLASSAAWQADCAEHPNFQAAGISTSRDRICARICARDPADRLERGRRQRSLLTRASRPLRSARPRRPGKTPETPVVRLITQRRATSYSCERRSYAVPLTATVTATSTATNGLRQPSTANHSRTI
jgi:hypothetical protein